MSDSATPWTVARQAPLFVGFSRQEYWSGLPFPPGDLSNPGIKTRSLAFQADSLDTPLPETLAQSTSWMSVYGAPSCRCPIIVTRLVFHSLVWPFMFVIKPTKLLSDAMSQDILQLIFIDENVQDKKAQRKTVLDTLSVCILYAFLLCGKVCLRPLRRESLCLFSFPSPHCLQLPSRLSYFLNLS